MRALRYGIAAAAICSGILVVPTSAQQAATTPVAMPAEQPAVARPGALPQQTPTTRPVFVEGQHGSWDRMGMRGFSVALVVGDLAGTATADNLPAGAKKALSDMRDFLPYKSFRLLDTHWILCCSSSSQASVSGRLRGAEEEEYSFNIHVRPVNDFSELGVTFSLRTLGVSADETHALTTVFSANDRVRRAAELIREREDLQRRYDDATKKLGEQHPERQKLRAEMASNVRRMEELDRAAVEQATTTRRAATRDTRPVLDSTFSMKVGETVVIGTSRLKGDKALIALLTAASRNSTPPR